MNKDFKNIFKILAVIEILTASTTDSTFTIDTVIFNFSKDGYKSLFLSKIYVYENGIYDFTLSNIDTVTAISNYIETI